MFELFVSKYLSGVAVNYLDKLSAISTINKPLTFFNVLADVISIFVYEVPCIFWRYINVDEVSLITLKKLLQSAMELLQIATA